MAMLAMAATTSIPKVCPVEELWLAMAAATSMTRACTAARLASIIAAAVVTAVRASVAAATAVVMALYNMADDGAGGPSDRKCNHPCCNANIAIVTTIATNAIRDHATRSRGTSILFRRKRQRTGGGGEC